MAVHFRAVTLWLALALVAASIAVPAGAQFAPPPERMRPATEFMEVREWEGERVGARSRITPLPAVEPLGYLQPPTMWHGLPTVPLADRRADHVARSGDRATTGVAEVARLREIESPIPNSGEFGYLSPQPPASSLPPPVYDPYVWQVLPDGLIYKSYLAGLKEARLGTQAFYERDEGWKWDITLGGRVGIVRYGTPDAANPEGWQIDVEGAAFPRLDPAQEMDLDVADFRAGLPITWGSGPWRTKLAYYHLSSHYGDEFLLRTATTTRFNYSRDAVVLGVAYYATDDVRLYAEADWGVIRTDVSEPWAFQFGVEFSPAEPTGFAGAPFLAVGAHLRQEIDFSGNLVVQTGWQWRGLGGDLLRAGFHYHNGLSNQFEIYNQFEHQIGLGLWYDF